MTDKPKLKPCYKNLEHDDQMNKVKHAYIPKKKVMAIAKKILKKYHKTFEALGDE